MKKITNESLGALHTHTHTGSLKENKKKNIKGITLVALVVTIIILLILAGISISALTQTGLFGKTKQAEQKSKDAQELENLTLADYENKIGDIVGTRQFDVKNLELDYDNKVDIKNYNSSSNYYTVPQTGIVIISGGTKNGWGLYLYINNLGMCIAGNGQGNSQYGSYSQIVTKGNTVYFSSLDGRGIIDIVMVYFIPFK